MTPHDDDEDDDLVFGQLVQSWEEIGPEKFSAMVRKSRARGARHAFIADAFALDWMKSGTAIRQGINRRRKSDGGQVFRAVAYSGALHSPQGELVILPTAQIMKPHIGMETRLAKFTPAVAAADADVDPTGIFAAIVHWDLAQMLTLRGAEFDLVPARKVPQKVTMNVTAAVRGAPVWWARQKTEKLGAKPPVTPPARAAPSDALIERDDVTENAVARETTLFVEIGKEGASGGITRRHSTLDRIAHKDRFLPRRAR